MGNDKNKIEKTKKVKPKKAAKEVKPAQAKTQRSSKNAIRLSTKLCFNIGIITVICLTVLVYLQNRDTTKLNTESTINNIQTALSAQDMIIQQFISDSENSMRQFGTATVVRDLLMDSENEELQETAENYTLEFYGTLPSWEAVYIGNPYTTVLTHSAPPAIGMTTRKPEDLEGFFAPCKAAPDGFYDGGVFVSPASGQIILNMRMALFDDAGEVIGYVGGGPFVSALGEKLKGYSISGLDDVEYSILDNEKNLYVIDNAEENLAQEVVDPIKVDIISRVNSGVMTGEVEDDNYLTCFRKLEGSSLVLTARIPLNDIKKLSNELANRLMIYCGVTFILIILGLIYVTSTTTRPLKKLAVATKTLADGYIEKPIDVTCYVKETLQIKEASVELQNALKELRMHLSDTANSLSDSAHMTHNLCASSEDSTTLISEAMEGLTNSVNSMESSVQTLKDEMSDIEENVNHISSAIESLSVSSDNMDKISEQAMEDINKVYTSSEKSVTAATEISAKMSELNDAIEAVAKATEIISGISSQTALLSLNASIEAARAGEMGKGFAVVADEIGKLAAQSDQSTKQIDVVISRMQELAKISVDSAENIKGIILNEQDIVKQTQDSFNELKGQIDGSIEQINQISEANTRLTMSKDSAMSSVANLGSISEDNAASNVKVNDSLTGLTENVSTLYGKTEDMTQMADTLEDVISVFKD